MFNVTNFNPVEVFNLVLSYILGSASNWVILWVAGSLAVPVAGLISQIRRPAVGTSDASRKNDD